METEQYVAEATKGGWSPKENWKGDPDKWVDAKEFVERGEKFAGHMKKERDDLKEKVEGLEKTLNEQKETFAEFQKFNTENRQREIANIEKAHKKEIAELKAEKKQALKDGDADLVVELDDKIDELKDEHKKEVEEKKTVVKEKNPASDAVFNKWLKENAWYNDDEDLNAYANGYGQKIEGKFVGKEFLDKIAERVKEKFPDKFENKNREKGSGVEGAGGSKQKRGKSYDDLPPEAKVACDKFVKTIKGFTVEQYLKDYDWE